MKALSSYASVVQNSVGVGKYIGDTFAWFFYKNEVEQIGKHYAHEPTRLISTGTGGKAEVEILNLIPRTKKHIIVYHGNTSFLRIGDLSFINLTDLSLDAIGELKAKDLGDGRVECKLVAVGPTPEAANVFDGLTDNQGSSENEPRSVFSASIERKLNRQVKKIGSSLNRDTEAP